MKTKPLIIALLALTVYFLTCPQIFAQEEDYTIADTQDVKVTLFDTDDLFEISLIFDIGQYKKQKTETEYIDAVLKYFNSENDSVVKDIKVKARGNIRRTAICDFPPLMLNLRMKSMNESEFAGLNKLKFVTYCKLGYEDYILREFLVYKLFNILTDYSFRVRLFKINYINSVKEKKPVVQYGFAIEPLNLVEKRTKTKEITVTGITQRSISQDFLDRAALFNYMIGNTDWSVPIKHNIQVLYKTIEPNIGTNIVIPYDFDYAGIVNTNYAVPFESLPIQSVRDRLYMAVCRDKETFASELEVFQEKKDEMFKVINDFPYLHPRSKKDMIQYLEGFFDGFDKRNSLINNISVDCGWFERQSNLKMR